MAVDQRIERGIYRRHIAACAYNDGKKCNKQCAYRAEVYDKVTKRTEKHTAASLDEARRWRESRRVAMDGGARVLTPVTVGELAAEFLAGAGDGTVRNASGAPYRAAMAKGLEASWRLHLLPVFGQRRAADLTTADVQRFIDMMDKDGAQPRSIHNRVMALRVVYKWAKQRGRVHSQPCDGVTFPAGEKRRDRIAPWPEAERMLQALLRADFPAWEVAFWATAFLGGLRRGELLGLEWTSVDLKAPSVTVAQSYDRAHAVMNAPKTANGTRTVPVPAQLVPYLELAAISGRGQRFVFSRDGDSHPAVGALIARAATVWKAVGAEPMTPHECRHTYASLMLAAGVDIYKVSKYMGHGSIQITVDRYGHLLEGADADTHRRFTEYLAEQTG